MIRSTHGGIWALLLGSIMAILQYFLGDIGESAGGFGFSRWLYGFINLISLPVLIPFVLYALLNAIRGFTYGVDFANFILLWLVPVAALHAISWESSKDVILLITVPLLWTALAVGIPFFIHWTMDHFRWYIAVISLVCIIALPVLAAGVYWAFFSQHTVLGFFMLAAVHVPLGFSLARDINYA
jgi:hypothetical protein